MNFLHIPEEIKNEFTIDADGKAHASQSAVGRLCGVSHQAINQLLEKIAASKALSKSLQPFAGKDYRGTSKMIPDILISAIINHYAMFSRHKTSQAKEVAIAFQAVGIRSWIQSELGWQQKQQNSDNYSTTNKLSFQDAMLLANFASESAINAGVDKQVSEQIKLESLIQVFPETKELLKPQKERIAASNPLSDRLLNPTEVGQLLAEKLGCEKISARAINKKLLALGYQIGVTRINSKKKTVHDYYRSTPKGEAYSKLLLDVFVDRDAKGTKAKLRWFPSIVEILSSSWH